MIAKPQLLALIHGALLVEGKINQHGEIVLKKVAKERIVKIGKLE